MDQGQFELILVSLWCICAAILYDKNKTLCIVFFMIALTDALMNAIITVLTFILK